MSAETNENSPHNILPYVSTWSNEMVGPVVLMADGSYGVAWELVPFDMDTLAEKDVLRLENHIYQLMSSLPHGSAEMAGDKDRKAAGAFFQFINFHSTDFSHDIDRMRRAVMDYAGLGGDALRQRVQEIERMALQGHFSRRRPILLMRYYPEQKKLSGNPLFLAWNFLNYSLEPSKIAALVTGRRLTQLAGDISIVESVMAGGSLAPRRMDEQELRELIYYYLNPASRAAAAPFDPSQTLRSQVMGDLLPGHMAFKLDDVWHAVITMRTLPNIIHSCSGSLFKYTEGDVVMNFCVQPPDITSKEFKRLERTMKWSIGDEEAMEGRKEIPEARNILHEGAPFGRASWHVVLRDEDIERLRIKVRNTMSLFSRIDGIEGRPERHSAPVIFFSACIPFACGPHFEKVGHRAKPSALIWLSNLSPIFGTYAGTATRPVLAEATENLPRGIFMFDPFDEHQVNWNGMVIGKSGSGKSTFLIRLMQAFNAYRPLIFITDKGGSYERFVIVNGGRHYKVTKNHPVCVNVFDRQDLPDTEETVSAVSDFAAFFIEMLIGEMTNEEYGLLGNTIMAQVSARKVSYLHELRDALNQKGEIGQRLAARMGLYIRGEGPLGAFVDGDNELDLSVTPVSIDLDGIYDDERLLPAYFMAIEQRKRQVLGRPEFAGRKHFHLFDEVWKPLQYEPIRNRLMGMNRTIRKEYGGGCVYYADQMIETYLQWPETAKMLKQTTNWFMLEMEPADLPNLSEAGFTEAEVEIMREKVKTVPGRYSMTYARHMDKGLPRGAIIRNEPSPLMYAIMTTDGEDVAVMRELEQRAIEQGAAPDEALEMAIRQFADILPRGIRPYSERLKQLQVEYPNESLLSLVERVRRS